MNKIFRKTLNIFKSYSLEDQKLRSLIESITGKKPITLKLYKLAIMPSSNSELNKFGIKESYERLEYLGDAFLGAIVAEYLYKKYPFKDEGFLTEIRARIVNRDSLNLLGRKIGLEALINFHRTNEFNRHKSIFGDILESIIGAIYLDYGFNTCKQFILYKLIEPNFNIDKIVSEDYNFKSQIIEWSQKNGKDVRFETVRITEKGNFKEFEISLLIDDEIIVVGHGLNKKKAEQAASRKALELNLVN